MSSDMHARAVQETIFDALVAARDTYGDKPILEGDDFTAGAYELRFHVGAYFASKNLNLPDLPFLDVVPIRFGISAPGDHYHVPLLVSPYAYSTYRGS